MIEESTKEIIETMKQNEILKNIKNHVESLYIAFNSLRNLKEQKHGVYEILLNNIKNCERSMKVFISDLPTDDPDMYKERVFFEIEYNSMKPIRTKD